MQRSEFKEKKQEFITFVTVEKNLSEHTQRAYESDLDQFISFWDTISATDGDEPPLRRAIERFLIHLYHKKITKSSIARKISCFKSFERYMIRQGNNLSLKLIRPRIDKKLPVFLTIDEVAHLLDSVDDSTLPTRRPLRDKAIFELLYATGVRCSELVNIKLAHIDLKNRMIRIMGKGRRERLALFGHKAQEKLEAYLRNERPQALTLDEYLFLNNRDEQLTSRSIQRILEMFRQFLKIERNITPHKLRHSFATHMLNRGVDLRMVQELLGHKSLASTEKYTHVTTGELKRMCKELHPIKDMAHSND